MRQRNLHSPSSVDSQFLVNVEFNYDKYLLKVLIYEGTVNRSPLGRTWLHVMKTQETQFVI